MTFDQYSKILIGTRTNSAKLKLTKLNSDGSTISYAYDNTIDTLYQQFTYDAPYFFAMSFSVTDKVHIGKVSDDFSTHNWKEIDLSSLLPKVSDYSINMGIKS